MCRPGDKKPLGLFIRVLPTAIPIPPFLIRALPVAIRVLVCVIRTLPVVIRALERAIRTLPGSISIPSPSIRILPVGIRKPAAGEQVFSAVIRANAPASGRCRSHTDRAGVRADICDEEKGQVWNLPLRSLSSAFSSGVSHQPSALPERRLFIRRSGLSFSILLTKLGKSSKMPIRFWALRASLREFVF